MYLHLIYHTSERQVGDFHMPSYFGLQASPYFHLAFHTSY